MASPERILKQEDVNVNDTNAPEDTKAGVDSTSNQMHSDRLIDVGESKEPMQFIPSESKYSKIAE